MTETERGKQIQAVKDSDLPLPLKARKIEMIIVEFRTSEHGDGRAAEERERQRARFDAYDAAPSNL